MTVKILMADKEMTERAKGGCKLYNLKFKINNRTVPYMHIEINTEEEAESLFWLGANLSHAKINSSLYQSSY